MKKYIKVILLTSILLGTLFVLVGCTEANKVSTNLSKEADNFNVTRRIVVMNARTDTKWFHKYIYKRDSVKIEFLKGRLKFGNAKNSTPFPSMIVVFYPF